MTIQVSSSCKPPALGLLVKVPASQRDKQGFDEGSTRYIFIGHFLQKSPTISGSFAENDQQLEASR